MEDTIQGHGPAPSIVMSYIRRLPDTSLTAALRAGDRSFFGWGADRAIAVDTFDLLALNTEASGNWAKKPPKLPRWERPALAKSERPPVTVASLWAQLSKR